MYSVTLPGAQGSGEPLGRGKSRPHAAGKCWTGAARAVNMLWYLLHCSAESLSGQERRSIPRFRWCSCCRQVTRGLDCMQQEALEVGYEGALGRQLDVVSSFLRAAPLQPTVLRRPVALWESKERVALGVGEFGRGSGIVHGACVEWRRACIRAGHGVLCCAVQEWLPVAGVPAAGREAARLQRPGLHTQLCRYALRWPAARHCEKVFVVRCAIASRLVGHCA